MTAEFCPKSAYIFDIFSFYSVWEVIVQPSNKSDLREDFHPQNIHSLAVKDTSAMSQKDTETFCLPKAGKSFHLNQQPP